MKPILSFALTLAFAGPPSWCTTLSFEGLADSTILTNQYAGVEFTNAIILTSGISLNEFEFPPHSGLNVLSDNGGPITITFATPINSYSGYFTYTETLKFQGFGVSNNLLVTTTSSFSNNQALSGVVGSSPNELDTFSSAAGIYSITISGDPLGGSFVMDDMSYSAVPEPPSMLLSCTFLLVMVGCFVKWRIRTVPDLNG